MKKELKCIMLIDDNADDNFFHEWEIKKIYPSVKVIAQQEAMKALNYLKSDKSPQDLHPDLIFLDINMPGMNGWEFLEEYKKLEEKFKSLAIMVMLTTSENPDDKAKSETMDVATDFKTKPLTQEMLKEIISKYFSS